MTGTRRLVASTVEGWSNCQRPLAAMGEAERGGMEYIQASELFPKKQLEREDEVLQVPFTEVHGEAVEYLGRADDAVIAISNYRLHIKYTDSVVNIPLRLIETVECRDIFQLYIACKDCKVVRCQFQTMEQCQEWGKRLVMACATPTRLEDLFAFAYHAWCLESPCGHAHGELYRPGEHITMRFENEVERMSFDMQDAWRISTINMNYRFCSSYPQRLIVPAWITDKELESVASFRTSKRIPTVVYRHGSNGAVIARSSQPEVSWWGWRNADDEHLVRAIGKSCAQDCGDQPQLNGGDLSLGSECSDFDASLAAPAQTDSAARPVPKLLILDARSYPAAIANRAKGGGCECPEYYPNCEIYFMGMANIHSIRKSFQALRALCTQAPDPSNWLSGLESTRWLQHLSLLLKAGGLVATTLSRDARSALVHCSDGWDRTPQVVALAKLLLDPYYRTIEGFQLLVETEWLDFGHKFGERCGHGVGAGDSNERCPVFLQWLDAVHQLLRQFPCSFEFNEAFLVKLVQHSHSCLYGTFLCNTPRERDENRSLERTCSIWSLLRPVSSNFHNLLYSAGSDMVLHPVCHVRSLLLWSGVYLPSFSPAPPTEDNTSAYPLPSEEVLRGRLPKTRSFDDLPAACDMNTPPLTRRSSDPNLNDLLPERRRSIDGVNMSLQAEPGISAILHREPVMQTLSPNPNSLLMPPVPASLPAEQISPQPDVVEHVEGLDLRRRQVSKEEILHERGQNKKESVVEFKTNSEVSVPPHLTTMEDFSGTLENQNLLWQQLPDITIPSQKGSERLLHVKSDIHNVLKETFQKNDEDVIAGGEAPCSLVVLRLQDKSSSALESSTETLTDDHIRTEPDYTRVVNGDGGTDCLGGYDDRGFTTSASSTFPPLSSDCHPTTEIPVSISSCSRAAGNHVSSTSASESRLYRSHKVRCYKVNGVAREGENGPENREVALRGCRVGIGCMGCRPCVLCARTDTPSSTESCQVVPTLRQTATSLRWSPPPGTLPGVTRCAAEDDGLPLHIDAVQARLRQMEAGHRHELMELQLQVQRLRVQVGHCGHREAAPTQHDDVNCAPESEGNPDYSSLSQCSTEQNSENSWEQVDRLDAEVTRWVPDHVANSCFSCDSKFWTVNRKHHCRNCGNVFCWNCCSQKVPVPSQQLYDPARVCKACYRYLIPSDGGRPLEFSALLDS